MWVLFWFLGLVSQYATFVAAIWLVYVSGDEGLFALLTYKGLGLQPFSPGRVDTELRQAAFEVHCEQDAAGVLPQRHLELFG